jgi:hypothetical protein
LLVLSTHNSALAARVIGAVGGVFEKGRAGRDSTNPDPPSSPRP